MQQKRRSRAVCTNAAPKLPHRPKQEHLNPSDPSTMLQPRPSARQVTEYRKAIHLEWMLQAPSRLALFAAQADLYSVLHESQEGAS